MVCFKSTSNLLAFSNLSSAVSTVPGSLGPPQYVDSRIVKDALRMRSDGTWVIRKVCNL
jgi:hypothetical protein